MRITKKKMKKRIKNILAYLARRKEASTKDVAKMCQLSHKEAYHSLKALYESGTLEKNEYSPRKHTWNMSDYCGIMECDDASMKLSVASEIVDFDTTSANDSRAIMIVREIEQKKSEIKVLKNELMGML